MRIGAQGSDRVGDPDIVEKLHRARAGGAGTDPEVEPHVLGQLAADRQHRVKRGHRVLEDHPDHLAADVAHRPAAEAQKVMALELRGALNHRAGGQQVKKRKHGDGLAAPTLPRDADDLSQLDVVVDPVDHGDESGGGREADAEPAHREQCGHRFCSLTAHDDRGSSASRRLSPRKLNASTTDRIAKPGKVPIHHRWKYCVPVFTIEPHSGAGG